MTRHDLDDRSQVSGTKEESESGNSDDRPGAAHRSVGRLPGVRLSRSLIIRLALASALILTAIVSNWGFVGWGLFAIFAILIVPVGRWRSFVISFIPYTVVWFTFTFLRSLADETILAEKVSMEVGNLERRIFGGQLPTNMLQDRLYVPGELHWYDYLTTFIHWSYFVVPHAVAIRTWYKNTQLYRHYLAGMTLLLALGLVLYFLIPSRPPWDTPEVLDTPSQSFVRRLMTPVAEQLGGGLYEAGYKVIGESNPWAAMPSIHTAITFLIVFPAFYAGRKWGYAALIYACSMGYSLIYLGEHFVLDVAAGIAVTVMGWYGAGWWLRRHESFPVSIPAGVRQQSAPAVSTARATDSP